MDFYSVIENRTSIKEFNSTPIDRSKLDRMINAAMMAPSWKNNTSYKIIIVDNDTTKSQLASTVKNNTDDAAKAMQGAPVVCVIVADPNMSGVVNNQQYYLVDSAIAMEHFILAAANEGYGTCWIGAFDENSVKSILNVPSNYRVVAMTPVGEIQQDKKHYQKKDVREYVFTNSWQQPYTENK